MNGKEIYRLYRLETRYLHLLEDYWRLVEERNQLEESYEILLHNFNLLASNTHPDHRTHPLGHHQRRTQ